MPSKTISQLPLTSPAPGTQRQLQLIRYGQAQARPKVHLQAALHADEIPGLLVLQKLIAKLDAADAAGQIKGHIQLLPFANPIGYAQQVLGQLQGRFDFTNGVNFNRDYPDLLPQLLEKLPGQLGADAEANVALIRQTAQQLLRQQTPETESAELKQLLLDLSLDADIALDLHCDSEAVMHLYTSSTLWPAAADLSAQLGCQVSLLAVQSGGAPYDEALSALWALLAQRFPDTPIPAACLAATIELRGERDVDETLAEQDADNLFKFLQRRGVISGDPGPLPAARCQASPLDGVVHVKAPYAGVVSYPLQAGVDVTPGTTVAVLFDPSGQQPRRELTSPIAGRLFTRLGRRLARSGEILVKIAGAESLPERQGKPLLTD